MVAAGVRHGMAWHGMACVVDMAAMASGGDMSDMSLLWLKGHEHYVRRLNTGRVSR